MAIQSVTSSLSSYLTNVQADQARQNQQTQAVQQPPETREAPRAQPVDQAEDTPRPVVNALGQQTGTLINVTA